MTHRSVRAVQRGARCLSGSGRSTHVILEPPEPVSYELNARLGAIDTRLDSLCEALARALAVWWRCSGPGADSNDT
jgi:hypothetical protein